MSAINPYIDTLGLTADQQKVSHALYEFFAGSIPVFLLKGYAGTGKTYLLGRLVENLRKINRSMVLMAPTGRAAQVLAQKTGEKASTIHSTIYFNQNKIYHQKDEDHEYDVVQMFYGIDDNQFSPDTVFIIDEASMISNISSNNEMLTFGSGYLLNDLIQYIWKGKPDERYKLIFAGDGAQLPPVDMNFSPALSADYLKKELGVWCLEEELTQVVRQKEGGLILKNATMLRRRIGSSAFGSLRLETGGEVQPISAESLIDDFIRLAGHKRDKAIIVSHANRMVYQYNLQVRKKLFPGVHEPVAGERLVVVHNNYYQNTLLLNGEIGTLVSIGSGVTRHKVIVKVNEKKKSTTYNKTVELRFREAVIQFGREDDYIQVERLILDNVLYSEERDISYHENVALFIDFKMRWEKAGKEPYLELALSQDPYFNALRVKFGYALTCHKSQGGEWPHVMVDCHTWMGINNQNYFRWLYTAITRAREGLWLINMPVFEDTLKMKAVQPKEPGAIPGDEQIKSIAGTSDCRGFAVQLYQKLLPALEGASCRADDVKYLDYSLQFTLLATAKKTLIRIFFNARKQVTLIEVMDVAGFDPDELKLLFVRIIQTYPGLKFNIYPASMTGKPAVIAETATFLSGLKNKIEVALQLKDIVIGKIESKDYHEIYHFYRGPHTAVIKFHYNKKMQITRYEVVPNRGNGLETEVIPLIKTIEL